jgi:hypothetical protein
MPSNRRQTFKENRINVDIDRLGSNGAARGELARFVQDRKRQLGITIQDFSAAGIHPTVSADVRTFEM